MTERTPKPPKPQRDAVSRAEREADALRENLLRRKQQARAREALETTTEVNADQK